MSALGPSFGVSGNFASRAVTSAANLSASSYGKQRNADDDIFFLTEGQ
jgi:hypothetical protein